MGHKSLGVSGWLTITGGLGKAGRTVLTLEGDRGIRPVKGIMALDMLGLGKIVVCKAKDLEESCSVVDIGTNHRWRKEVLFWGGGGQILLLVSKARTKYLGPCPLSEVQRSLVAIKGSTAVLS